MSSPRAWASSARSRSSGISFRTNPGSVGTAANRWSGANYSGWANQEYDRLYAQFASTLDAGERNQQVVQMAKILSEEVGVIMLFFNYNVSAHSSAVTGPDPKAFDTLVDWNIDQWQIK